MIHIAIVWLYGRHTRGDLSHATRMNMGKSSVYCIDYLDSLNNLWFAEHLSKFILSCMRQIGRS